MSLRIKNILQSPVIWIFIVILGLMISKRFVAKRAERLKPGAERNDLVLADADVPAKISNWQKRHFIPAPDPKSLPKGRYWWVHHWQFPNDCNSAIVSCDQLGETQWHELMFCYRN